MASEAHAQAPRSRIDTAATPGVPEFRDPKTGEIWTPLNVGQQSGPPTPADLAFDPLGQAVRVEGVVVQRPSVVPLGSVPITAGPTVPLVNIGDATLRAGGRQALAGRALPRQQQCRHRGADDHLPVRQRRNLVEQTHVLVPAVGPAFVSA